MEENVEMVFTTNIKSTIKNGKLYTEISAPEDQKPIPLRVQTYILTSAVAMLIKTCNKFEDGPKDFELIKDVKEHLDAEFTSPDTYTDIEIDRDRIGSD